MASTIPTTATNAAEAKVVVDGKFRQGQITLVQLTGKSVGDPSLLAKSINRINGIRRLSGNYYFSSVKHTVNSSGYVNEWKAKRDGKSSAPGTKPVPSSATTNDKQAPVDDAKNALEAIDTRHETTTTTWSDSRGRSSGTNDPTPKATK